MQYLHDVQTSRVDRRKESVGTPALHNIDGIFDEICEGSWGKEGLFDVVLADVLYHIDAS